MPVDVHDNAALAHYMELIEARYPPDLAAALVAARYQIAVVAETGSVPLPMARQVVRAIGESHPAVRRQAGQLLEKIDGEMGLPVTIQRRNNRRS